MKSVVKIGQLKLRFAAIDSVEWDSRMVKIITGGTLHCFCSDDRGYEEAVGLYDRFDAEEPAEPAEEMVDLVRVKFRRRDLKGVWLRETGVQVVTVDNGLHFATGSPGHAEALAFFHSIKGARPEAAKAAPAEETPAEAPGDRPRFTHREDSATIDAEIAEAQRINPRNPQRSPLLTKLLARAAEPCDDPTCGCHMPGATGRLRRAVAVLDLIQDLRADLASEDCGNPDCPTHGTAAKARAAASAK